MVREVLDCFADDPNIAFHLVGLASYVGPEAIRGLYMPNPEKSESPSGEFLHVTMPLSPVITISADGNSAMGRWYSTGEVAMPMGPGVFYQHMLGIYENEYIKQNGKWKIKVIEAYTIWRYKPEQGFVRKDRLMPEADPTRTPKPAPLAPPPVFDIDPSYPSGYIVPFHYEHPVTGKPTSEAARNASLK